MGKELLGIAEKVARKGWTISTIINKLTLSLKGTMEYVLPILCVLAIIIAGGYIMFGHREGWKRFALATTGASIMYLSVSFLTSLNVTTKKFSTGTFEFYMNGMTKFLESSVQGIIPAASILSLTVAAGMVMFSSRRGWERVISAIVGSAIAFGAVLITDCIVSMFNSLF